jgi:predicted AlkP superfamily pyrophosphatase or phosphodiesterase
MPMLLSKCLAIVSFPILAASAIGQTQHQPVLLISVDGMRPDYVTHADEHHLRIPTLRSIMATGTHATGVNGVMPTITYPSHTTLVTGVPPSEHGILGNTRFDPERQLAGAWYWYADAVKVPTLWSAAKDAGLHTASVSWPVTVDSNSIDYNLPEYWRGSLGSTGNPDDRYMMNAVSRPDGELARLSTALGQPYTNGTDTSLEGDETRTRFSIELMKEHKPELITIHLSSLDEEEHLHGPFSEEANKDLEGLDGMVGRLAQQELANFPDAIIAVVSDHGFARVDHAVNLPVAFVKAGLMKVDDDTVVSWKAQPWATGCVMPIELHDPADAATKAKVKSVLDAFAANPANGVASILDHDKLVAAGGFPDVPYLVSFKIGYCSGTNLDGAVVVPSPLKGAHGYNVAEVPEMRSAFFITGKGITAGKNLGIVDMRQIAPTLAGLLGVSLPSAKQAPLAVR